MTASNKLKDKSQKSLRRFFNQGSSSLSAFAFLLLTCPTHASDDLQAMPAPIDTAAPLGAAATKPSASAAVPAMVEPEAVKTSPIPSTPPPVTMPSSNSDGAALAAAVTSESAPKEELVRQQINLLNQVPESQLTAESDPGLSIVKTLHELDGPDFLELRKLVGQAKVRGPLTPGARAVIAGVISQRWDAFALAGNLWLGALKSTDPAVRAKARQKIVCFIQTAHLSSLIDMLSIPGTNAQAYEVLQEVTGQSLPPDVKAWRAWWAKQHGQFDVVDVILKDTQEQVTQHPITPFDADRFWYTPEGIDAVAADAAHRTPKEDQKVQEWSGWVGLDVKHTVDQWAAVKPALDRLTHQPDPRVKQYLEGLVSDPGFGNYASVVLAWRGSLDSLPVLQKAYDLHPTVGRALARGSLGDKTALKDLLKMIAKHPQPLTFALMDDSTRTEVQVLHTVGELPAEQAFELLSHRSFDFLAATSKKEKKKSLKDADRWLGSNLKSLTLDHGRGYYTPSASK